MKREDGSVYIEERGKRKGNSARAMEAKPKPAAPKSSDQPNKPPASKPSDGKSITKNLTYTGQVTDIPPDLQKPVVGESFLILPLASMTELQRNYRWNYNNVKLFVIINGEALLNGKGTTLNTAALDHQGIAAALSKYKSAVGGFTILEVDNQSQSSPSAFSDARRLPAGRGAFDGT